MQLMLVDKSLVEQICNILPLTFRPFGSNDHTCFIIRAVKTGLVVQGDYNAGQVIISYEVKAER